VNNTCDIVKDLLPLYVENLTSEASNQFIDKHLHSCEDCKIYLKNIQSDLPRHDSLDLETEKGDKKLIKSIQKNINKMKLIGVFIGILIGVFTPLLYLNVNTFPFAFVVYSVFTFFIGFLGYVIFRNPWIGPIVVLIGSLISISIFVNLSSLVWVIVYFGASLLGSIMGVGIEKVKYPKIKITLNVLIAIIGVITVGISLIILSFFVGMTPDKTEITKVTKQAEEYPNEKYEIYDTLYDNMGNFPQFDYAAKVRNLDSDETFLVYYNDKTEQMEDSLKYADEFQ